MAIDNVIAWDYASATNSYELYARIYTSYEETPQRRYYTVLGTSVVLNSPNDLLLTKSTMGNRMGVPAAWARFWSFMPATAPSAEIIYPDSVPQPIVRLRIGNVAYYVVVDNNMNYQMLIGGGVEGNIFLPMAKTFHSCPCQNIDAGIALAIWNTLKLDWT